MHWGEFMCFVGGSSLTWEMQASRKVRKDKESGSSCDSSREQSVVLTIF